MIRQPYRAWPAAAYAVIALAACAPPIETQNSLAQHTGEAGSTMRTPNAYPNTSGNIVAAPGNPGGNPSGSPPIVGGTTNQQPAWPDNR